MSPCSRGIGIRAAHHISDSTSAEATHNLIHSFQFNVSGEFMHLFRLARANVLVFVSAVAVSAQQPTSNPRARDLGIPFDGTPGPLNAITDVSGITVGHSTLISGE